MVYRDPDTGKFVSGGSHDYSDLRSVSGSMTSTVPAADLSGGTSPAVAVNGEDAEIIDFSGVIDSDEVFEAVYGTAVVTLSMPTTATAEGYSQLEWALRTDLGDETGVGSTHLNGTVQNEVDKADLAYYQADGDDFLSMGRLTSTPSIGDSVNGLGAGSAEGFDRVELPFASQMGTTVQFDQNDEVTAPHTFQIDNVSDHAVTASFDVVLWGHDRHGNC